MTIKDIIPGMVLKTVSILEGRTTPYIDIGKCIVFNIHVDTELVVVETPRSYKGGGRCIKYRVVGSDVDLYSFWIEFKRSL